MSAASLSDEENEEAVQLADEQIPVRNVWFLFLYAYNLAQFQGRFEAEIEDSPNFKALVARLLCHVVETRLRRNLSFGYHRQEDILKRVRGRIDILEMYSRDLFHRGEVACRFEELTIDTPRNRFLRAALSVLGRELEDQALACRSKALAAVLGRAGVGGILPSRAEMTSDQIGRHEADDRLMVSLAQAVFKLILPTEKTGVRTLLEAQRKDTAFRKLFERAIGNFFVAELPRDEGWRVYPGKWLDWPIGFASPNLKMHFPKMKTDIIIENELEDQRIIIDTKFTNVLTKAQFGDGQRFKTDHIYQLYSYLRSQECDNEPRSLNSEGVLLYPAIKFDVDEAAEIQGHVVRFTTINLAAPTSVIVEKLRQLPISSCLLRNAAISLNVS